LPSSIARARIRERLAVGEKMNQPSTNDDDNAFCIEELDYLTWALSTASIRQSPKIWTGKHYRRRVSYIARTIRNYSGFDRLEILQLALLSCELRSNLRIGSSGVDKPLLFFAASDSVLTNVSDFGLLGLREELGAFLKLMCTEYGNNLAAVAEKAGVSESTARLIVSGQVTRVDTVDNLCRAAGFRLSFWFDFGLCDVGDESFNLEFPEATRSAYETYRQQNIRRSINAKDFWSLIHDDIT
jgi:transcriptional regulator with XRE-family HTH domain